MRGVRHGQDGGISVPAPAVQQLRKIRSSKTKLERRTRNPGTPVRRFEQHLLEEGKIRDACSSYVKQIRSPSRLLSGRKLEPPQDDTPRLREPCAGGLRVDLGTIEAPSWIQRAIKEQQVCGGARVSCEDPFGSPTVVLESAAVVRVVRGFDEKAHLQTADFSGDRFTCQGDASREQGSALSRRANNSHALGGVPISNCNVPTTIDYVWRVDAKILVENGAILFDGKPAGRNRRPHKGEAIVVVA